MAITIQDSGATDIDFVRESFQMQGAATQRGKLQFQHIGTSKPLDWGDEVYVYDGVTKIWGGSVESITETDITVGNTTTIRFTFDCMDFSQIMGRSLVTATYTSTTAGAIATAFAGLLYPSQDGVTVGTIETGATIDSITFNYLPIETCLDELAEMSGFYWDVDKDKKLNFRAIDSAAAPFDLTNTNQPYRGITFQERRGQFANAVYVRAGTRVAEDNTVETQYGDGEKRVFVVGSPIGAAPTIEVDTGGGFSSQTVGVNGIGTASQWYYNVGTPVIVQDSGETVLGATDRVKVTYKARFPIIVYAENEASILERAAAETGLGFHFRVIDALDVEDLGEAQQKAEAILQQYSAARLTVRYTTDTTGLEAGMSQLINLTEHGINARFLLESVAARMLPDGTLRYDVQGAATQTVAGWSYWKQKTRQDRKFVVRDNEILDTLKRISEDVTIDDAPSSSTTTGNGFNVGAATAIVGLVDVG